MHGAVATGRPATALFQVRSVVNFADVDRTRGVGRLELRVTLETEVLIRLHEQLGIHRAVRLVANHAAFAQGRVLEREGPGLFAVTLGAGFIHPRHRQTAFGSEDIAAMRIMAMDAVHPIFEDGMMLRQLELSVRGEMAFEARGGILAGIQNELPSAAGCDVLAARAVTRFTTTLPGHGAGLFQMDARVRTRSEGADIIGVAIEAGAIAGIVRPGNFERIGHGARQTGTRIEKEAPDKTGQQQQHGDNGSRHGRRQLAGVGMIQWLGTTGN